MDDDEVFKICLDFWNYFVPDVYASVTTGMADANAAFAFGGAAPAATGRRHLYGAVLSRLRLLMISRMAKPEEVRCPLPLSDKSTKTACISHCGGRTLRLC